MKRGSLAPRLRAALLALLALPALLGAVAPPGARGDDSSGADSAPPAAPAADDGAEVFPGERAILARLERKGVPRADLPAPPVRGRGEGEDAGPRVAAYRVALGRAYLARVGVGDTLIAIRRFFSRGGECERAFPGVRAELAREADFLDRPTGAILGDPSDLELHVATLRAAYVILPLIVRPEPRVAPAGAGAAGADGIERYEVAPSAEWLLLEVAPDIRAAAAASVPPGARPPLRRFLGRDALRKQVEETAAANARRAAIAYWERVPAGRLEKVGLGGGALPALARVLLGTPLETLFGERFEPFTEARGKDRLPLALGILSLTPRGRAFLDELLARVAGGEMKVEVLAAGPDLTVGYWVPRRRTLEIRFESSPPMVAATIIHEGAHGLDYTTNGILEYLEERAEREGEAYRGLVGAARAAAAAQDDEAVERYVARLQGLLGQQDDIELWRKVEVEYVAWRAEASFETEACFLVLTEAMAGSLYLIDRDRFEDQMKSEGAYGVPPAIVEELLAAKDWEGPEEPVLRPEGWRRYADPSLAGPLATAADWRRRGDAHRAVGRDDRALADYDRALALDRTCAAAYSGRAGVRAARGDHARAVADFGRALEQSPRLEEAVLGRARSLRALGSYRRALADHDRAIAGGPRDPVPWEERGRTYLEVGRWREALDDLARAVALAPRRLEARLLRARAFRGVGEVEKALADLDLAVAKDPHFAEARVERAEIALDQDRLDAARADLDAAIEARPDLARAYAVRAALLARLGRAGEAARDRRTAEDLEARTALALEPEP